MERIQEALAKARASRSGNDGTTERVGRLSNAAAVAVEPPALPPEVDNAWAALQKLELSDKRIASQRLYAVSGGQHSAPFDVLRTKVLQTMRKNNWRRIAITSASAGCGKSTVSMNLAFGLGRQPQRRTLLCEVDLRRPSIARALGVKDYHSFASVLEGNVPFADDALCYNGNLALGINTAAYSRPAELLHGDHVASVLQELEDTYQPDYVIFDMPPMLVNDDAMAFMGNVDCALLIAAAEATTIKEIDVCERELAAQTNVMGVIVNKCRYIGREYGQSYYG